MQATQSNFDSESVDLMGRVCDDVWREMQRTMLFPSLADADAILHQMVARVMAAVAGGERDPVRLKAVAIDGLEG